MGSVISQAAFLILALLSPSPAQAPSAVPAWVAGAMAMKPKVLALRVSGNRGGRAATALFVSSAAASLQAVEEELLVYGISPRNRVAKAAAIAKETQQTLKPDAFPPEFLAEEFHVLVPKRIVRVQRGQSTEELLNVVIAPPVPPLRTFEPSADYRRLLAIPPNWELTAYAYDLKAIRPHSVLRVFYTKTKEQEGITPEYLR